MRFLKNKGTDTKWIIYIIAATILLPIIISFFCWIADFTPQILFFKIGSNSDWIAFWGSVSGSILGVFGTYKVLRIQLENDKKQYEEAQKRYEETQIDNTFFNMIGLFQNIQDNLREDSTNRLLKHIKYEKSEFITTNNDSEKIELYEKNKDILKSSINNLASTELMQTDSRVYIEALSKQRGKTEDDLNNFISIYPSMIENKNYVPPILENTQKSISELDNLYKQFKLIDSKYNNYIFNEEEIFQIANDLFSYYQSELGTFLRMFYRIVKYIMDSGLSMEKKKEYLGMLRALLSSNEMLVVFYNCFYTTRGVGLQKVLNRVDKKGKKTGFFADELDLQHFNIKEGGQVDLPFFKYSELIFGDRDLEKIKSLTN